MFWETPATKGKNCIHKNCALGRRQYLDFQISNFLCLQMQQDSVAVALGILPTITVE